MKATASALRPRKPSALGALGRHQATKAEAQAIDKQVTRIVGDMKSNWLRLGNLVQRVIDTRAWAPLGFPNMDAWINARLGESARRTAYLAVRNLKALKGIPEEKLKQIGPKNAEALTYLPERQRKSEEWIDKAATLPVKEFKQEVEAAREKATGHPPEEFRTFSIRVTKRVYDDMVDAEAKVARMLSLDIEQRPGLKGEVWFAIATMVNTTPEEHLIVEIEGATPTL